MPVLALLLGSVISKGAIVSGTLARRGTQDCPPILGAGEHPWIAGSGWESAWNTSLPTDAADQMSVITCDSNGNWTDTEQENET